MEFVVRRLGLAAATVNLCTKFEVSTFTNYEDTKGDAKCRHWDSFGMGYGVPKVVANITTR